MDLAFSRGLYAVCIDCRTTLLTSPHLQLSVNMLLRKCISSYLAGNSRHLTRISIGGTIPRCRGTMCLVVRKDF